MAKYQSSVEIVIAARDRASKVIDSVGSRFRRFGQQLSGLESSNQVLGALIGGGALAGVDELGRKLGDATDKTLELVDAFRDGKLDAGEFISELAAGTPVVGGFFQAGQNLRAWLDGSKQALEDAKRLAAENEKLNKIRDEQNKLTVGAKSKADQLQNEVDLLRVAGDQTRALMKIDQERQAALQRIEQERRKVRSNNPTALAELDRQAQLINERARRQTTETLAGFREANQKEVQAEAKRKTDQRAQAEAIRRQNEELRLRNQGADDAADVLAITNQYAAAIEQATQQGNDPLVKALEDQKRLRLAELAQQQAEEADTLNQRIDKGLDDFFKDIDQQRESRDRGPQVLEARFLGSVPQRQETAVADTARHTSRTAEATKAMAEYLKRLLDRPPAEPVTIVQGRLN